MRFYYNASLSFCATEDWVIRFFIINGNPLSEKELKGKLRSTPNFLGWTFCKVCDEIEDKFNDESPDY